MKQVVIVVATLLWSAPLHAAYQARCNGGAISNVTINSVLGEPRPLEPSAMARFHSGVDIANCNAGSTVQPIAGGKVTQPTVCQSPFSTCVRVTDSTGRSFDYEHLTNITVSQGDTVTTATTIGEVDTGEVLHLQEVYSTGGLPYRYNPERTNALSFNPVDIPNFSTTTVGPIAEQQIILISEYGDEFGRPQPDGYQTSPSTFQWRSNVYYVRGKVDVLLSARGGTKRKGLYVAGFDVTPSFGRDFRYDVAFNALPDRGTLADDFKTIYWARDPSGFTYFASNILQNAYTPWASAGTGTDSTWNTGSYTGPATVCGFAQSFPQGAYRTSCANAYVDNSPPTIAMSNTGGSVTDGGATSTATITIQGTDSGGIYSISLAGVSYSSTNYPSGVQTSPSNTFPDSSTLPDGSYTATVVDLAGNSASATFIIDTGNSSTNTGPRRGPGGSSGNPTNLMCLVFHATSTVGGSGIRRISSNISATAYFPPGTNPAVYASSACAPSTGTVTVSAETWAGVVTNTNVTVSSAPLNMTVVGGGSGWSDSGSVFVGDVPHPVQFIAHFDWPDCTTFKVTAQGKTLSCVPECGGCAIDYKSDFYGAPAPSYSWAITNLSVSSFTGHSIVIKSDMSSLIASITTPSTMTISPGGGISGSVTIPELQGTTFTCTLNASTLTVYSPYAGVVLSTTGAQTSAQYSSRLRNVLRHSGSEFILASADGGAAVFDSTMTMNFQYADSSVDTGTARIYSFEGVDWTSSTVSHQSISVASGVVTAVGWSTHTALFAVFYAGQDSSAPVTTFIIQGSSYSFGGTMFVSTDTYLVLAATDPVVNGFASTVATITYRFDPSSGTAFSVYTSSIPAPLGTHVFQYQSWDYAGNAEAVKTATFTVTAGAAFKDSSDDTVRGNLLVGFLGSGAQAEVAARAQDDFALAVSSPDKTALLNVNNIGSVGVGVAAPNAQLDIGAGSPSLQLRSGNAVSTGTSAQMTFGYNGDVSMRHALRTYHSTATLGNEMDFYLWTPAAGSTATVGSAEILALQSISTASGGAMHVRPVGYATADLAVSNGLSYGAGTMERLQLLSPSSRRFKSDISYLGEKEEDRALAETAALSHVRFRYKSRAPDGSLYDDPRQPERVGLIYEDAPDSLREKNGTISTNERVANLELALKAAMRKLEKLQKRSEALKAKGAKP